jgi:hypothetical protein
MSEMKTIEIEARNLRRGDRIVERRPQDPTLIREVAKVSSHLGGRELFLEFKGGSPGLVVRLGHVFDVEEASRESAGAGEALSKVAAGEREIAAGDGVVTLDREGRVEGEGVLRDVFDGDIAEVEVRARKWITLPLDRIAHPDSPYAEAHVAGGDEGVGSVEGPERG